MNRTPIFFTYYYNRNIENVNHSSLLQNSNILKIDGEKHKRTTRLFFYFDLIFIGALPEALTGTI